MKKKSDLIISIALPDDSNATKLTYYPDGSFKVFDDQGDEVEPEKIERTVQYKRDNPNKGPKYQTKSTELENVVTVGGLNELASLDSFIVVDTNSTTINNRKISATCFSEFKLVKEANKYRVISLFQNYGVYEIHDVEGNPEMLAIVRLANDIIKYRKLSNDAKIAFITDSDMDSHSLMSTQKIPIYGKHYLPKEFILIYASSDTGQELINKLIRVMDKGSKKYLTKLNEKSIVETGLHTLSENSDIKYRCTMYPDIKIINPLIKEVTASTKPVVKFS